MEYNRRVSGFDKIKIYFASQTTSHDSTVQYQFIKIQKKETPTRLHFKYSKEWHIV